MFIFHVDEVRKREIIQMQLFIILKRKIFPSGNKSVLGKKSYISFIFVS